MAHEISRREVLNNLIRFKDSLLEKPPTKESGNERTYKVLINRKTGDMRFPERIKSLEYRISRKKERGEALGDWKEVQIIVKNETNFELVNLQNKQLEPNELDPLSWRVARETVDVLNAKVKEVAGPQKQLPIEEAVLNDLSSIHISTTLGRVEDHPAWRGALSRIDAEKKLDGKPKGTYLIREADPLTQAMGFHVSEENREFIRSYLLTVVEDESKISDILLIETPKGWIYYRDDPNLNNSKLYKYEPTVEALLQKLTEIAKVPIT